MIQPKLPTPYAAQKHPWFAASGGPAAARVHLLAALALVAFSLLAACGAGNQAGVNPAVQIALIPAPEGKDGEYLTVALLDVESQPITDAGVGLEGNMSHAGMVPVISDTVHDADDGVADGRYQVPFRFTMLGDWIMTVSVQLADGTAARQDINLTVTAEEVKLR